jgi:hypothetical protein
VPEWLDFRQTALNRRSCHQKSDLSILPFFNSKRHVSVQLLHQTLSSVRFPSLIAPFAFAMLETVSPDFQQTDCPSDHLADDGSSKSHMMIGCCASNSSTQLVQYAWLELSEPVSAKRCHSEAFLAFLRDRGTYRTVILLQRPYKLYSRGARHHDFLNAEFELASESVDGVEICGDILPGPRPKFVTTSQSLCLKLTGRELERFWAFC